VIYNAQVKLCSDISTVVVEVALPWKKSPVVDELTFGESSQRLVVVSRHLGVVTVINGSGKVLEEGYICSFMSPCSRVEAVFSDAVFDHDVLDSLVLDPRCIGYVLVPNGHTIH